MTLIAGDSAVPQPARYAGHDIWGVYVAGDAVHIWTREEVAALKDGGVRGALPIVVPPQGERWWEQNHGYAVLEQLVRDALAWGLPEGSPVCLDVEEAQFAAMIAPSDVFHAWAVACRIHKLRNWTYGSRACVAADLWAFTWLADWPEPTPSDPRIPEGITAWQYAGNVNGIDESVFRDGHDFLSPDLSVVTLSGLGQVAPPAAPSEPAGSPVPVGGSDPASTVTGTGSDPASTVTGTGTAPAVSEASSNAATSPVTGPSSPEAESETASPAPASSRFGDLIDELLADPAFASVIQKIAETIRQMP